MNYTNEDAFESADADFDGTGTDALDLDPELANYQNERDQLLREIADRENDLMMMRLDLGEVGAGADTVMLKRIARAAARVDRLRACLEELDQAWDDDHAFDAIAL
jgi:hypothetical protein